jgi:hypothetical protein
MARRAQERNGDADDMDLRSAFTQGSEGRTYRQLYADAQRADLKDSLMCVGFVTT